MDNDKTTEATLDAIETLCDQHKAQFTLTRAASRWIVTVNTADGRSTQHQSPLDQHSVLSDALNSLEHMVATL